MAFYGDLFLVPGRQGDEPAPLTDTAAVLAEQLAEEWLERAAARASSAQVQASARRELATMRGEAGVAQGRGEAARVAAKSLAKIRWFASVGFSFAESWVNRSLAQVTAYLTDDTIRSAAQSSVHALIGPETKVVIGHSLGSVVAYETLRSLDRPLPLFITLGSPLGLETIVYPRLRPQPPRFPAAVERWVNVADRDDIVAAEPNLTNLFKEGIPAGAVFEGGYTVDNGAEPHRATFYLEKADVGRPLGHVLSTVA